MEARNFKKNQIILINQLYYLYLDKIFYTDRFKGKAGIEIGGPSDMFCNIYGKCSACDNVNFSDKTVWWENKTGDFSYKGRQLGKSWILEATNMDKIGSESYDFVLSSNNLEHIANPLQAIKEFSRVVKIGGTILVTVPMKEKMFDHNRKYTEFEHLLSDYRNHVGEDDLTHLPEILENHDYLMDDACGGKELFLKRVMKNVENRCLHHQVFEEDCLRKCFVFAGISVIDFSEIMSNWLIIGEKRG